MNFTKMHGTGNDYIYVNAVTEKIKKPDQLSVKISDRHFGIGSDGLILIERSDIADFRMQIFNPDGSEAEMCGNGIRCFAKYVFDRSLVKKQDVSVETLAGIKTIKLAVKNKKAVSAVVDMGEPEFLREKIPMIGSTGMVINEPLPLDDGTRFDITAVSMGNPHTIIFVEDIENFPVHKYGPIIENHDLFPNRTNVEFVKIISSTEVIQRTWERGAGETLSCGTGASAVTAACILNKKTDRKITIHLRGGDLETEWRESDNHIFLSGPAVEVYEGVWED